MGNNGHVLRAEQLRAARDVGERLRKLREQLPADSPFASVAFRLAALTGEIESFIAAQPIDTQSVTQSSTEPGDDAAQGGA